MLAQFLPQENSSEKIKGAIAMTFLHRPLFGEYIAYIAPQDDE